MNLRTQIESPTLISIVIPTYERASLLRRAIASVAAQTFTDWELIVVDDTSTDKDIAAEVAGFSDSRMRCIRHDTNRGAPAARNTGMRLAQGQYIALLDSDDEWLPEKLEAQLERFESPQVDNVAVVLCNTEILTSRNGEVVKKCAGSVRAFRRNVYLTLLGRRDMRPTSTLLIHLHEGAQISTSSRRMPGMEQALEKHYEELRVNPVALSSHHSVLALRYCRPDLLDPGKARAHLLAAIKAAPWMTGPWVWFAALMLSPQLFRRIKFAWPKNLPFGAWHRLEDTGK